MAITLSDFGPESIWYVSVGHPAGEVLDLFWEGEDTEDGTRQPMDGSDLDRNLPFTLDLLGHINEAGEWCWDGQGWPRDHSCCTITDMKAFRP